VKRAVSILSVSLLAIPCLGIADTSSIDVRNVAEARLRTINAQLVAYLKIAAVDSVVTGEEMRNLVEGIEWFDAEKEATDSVLASQGIQPTHTQLIPKFRTAYRTYTEPLLVHRDNEVEGVRDVLGWLSGVPLRSVGSDAQVAALLAVSLIGLTLVGLIVYGYVVDRFSVSFLASLALFVGLCFFMSL
jgi:hypothetical protein